MRVEGYNPNILKECRQQLGLSLADVEKKVKNISKIENGQYIPTFSQIENLSKIYHVPRWIFISDKLPDEYNYSKSVPAFRQFSEKNPDIFSDPSIRILATKIDKLRYLLLDLLDDLDQEVVIFNPPHIDTNNSPLEVSKIVWDWLNVKKQPYAFKEWKDILEKKGIFIFSTSKYLGWSHVEREKLRGFSIYHDTQPIIVINDSDWKKAQSFTLFHELAHILRKESSIDDWRNITKVEEQWCDDFAGNMLIQKEIVSSIDGSTIEIHEVKRIAARLKVSSYSLIVRLRRLEVIDSKKYTSFEDILKKEYIEYQKLLKQESTISRNRSAEIIKQYGNYFSSILFQAYRMNEIGVTKLAKILDVKNVKTIFEIEEKM